jgi:MFS transporter, DHA2 family, methylenomycin A resistance protein
MVGATLGVAILGALFAADAGSQTATAGDFLAGLRAALCGGGAGELLGALIAVVYLRKDSLKQTD